MLGQLRVLPKMPNDGTDQHDLLWDGCPAVIVALRGGLLPALQQSTEWQSEAKLLQFLLHVLRLSCSRLASSLFCH